MKAMMSKSNFNFIIIFILLTSGILMNSLEAQDHKSKTQNQNELKAVTQVLNNVFGWAVNKDFELFFNSISDDSNFISVTPYKKVKFGVAAVKQDSAFWGSPNFKAIRHEMRDLRIHFSASGDVAWFYCVLDDINTWKDEPANWENVRWTGVLEKRKGVWRVAMQHFSWPKENQ